MDFLIDILMDALLWYLIWFIIWNPIKWSLNLCIYLINRFGEASYKKIETSSEALFVLPGMIYTLVILPLNNLI